MVYERKLKTNDEILHNLSWYKIDFFFQKKVDRSAKQWEIKGRHFLGFPYTHLTTSARSANL